MRALRLIGLGSLLCIALACSNEPDSTVTPAGGAVGRASTSGVAATAAVPNTGGSAAVSLGGSITLGGNLTLDQGGTGADAAMPELPSDGAEA